MYGRQRTIETDSIFLRRNHRLLCLFRAEGRGCLRCMNQEHFSCGDWKILEQTIFKKFTKWAMRRASDSSETSLDAFPRWRHLYANRSGADTFPSAISVLATKVGSRLQLKFRMQYLNVALADLQSRDQIQLKTMSVIQSRSFSM
jgi:hypothetical protein